MHKFTILFTNITLDGYTGTEIVIRDLALKLNELGHRVFVYSPRLGGVSTELISAGISVVNDLSLISEKPDVIHGHHYIETLQAILAFPDTPAIFVCHDRLAWHDTPPYADSILAYVAVSYGQLERIINTLHISVKEVKLIPNIVDIARFQPRPPLPQIPKTALMFSNYVNQTSLLKPYQEACQACNITLSVLGFGLNKGSSTPEQILPEYDIVFAVGKCALEAMAVGCSVIPAVPKMGLNSIGAMITTENMIESQLRNFAQCMIGPATVDNIIAQIKQYNAKDAEQVSAYIREHVTLEKSVDTYLQLYNQVTQQWEKRPRRTSQQLLYSNLEFLLQNLNTLEKAISPENNSWERNKWQPKPQDTPIADRLMTKMRIINSKLKENPSERSFYALVFMQLKKIYRRFAKP